MRATTMRVLGALVALLFAGGVVGLVTVSGDDGDELDTAGPPRTVSTSVGTTGFVPGTEPTSTTSVTAAGGQFATSTTVSTTTTVAGSGLAIGGSATVQGSGEMADTGGEDFVLPGLALLALALGARRLRARTVD